MCIRDRSYIYFPLLEETGFVPQQKYTNAPETLEYCKVICEKFKLYDNAYMQTEVTSTDWDEECLRWTVKTNQGDELRARYVVHSNGPLNRPKLPAIKGINDLKVTLFILVVGTTLTQVDLLMGTLII